MSNDILVKIGADVAGFSRDMKKVTDDLSNISKNTEKSNVTVGKLAKSLGLVAVGAKAFQVLSNSVGDAISRFDTLNQFPKVLEALGVSAEDADKSVQTLSDGIDGLPTKLDDIASTAQRMYTSFSDMDKATESALALNNALLGSGSSAEQASRGTEMYLKMLQTGQVDLQTWRSLSETMDVGLIKVAESFGYVGKTAKDDLYRALQDGTHTIDDFNDKLIEVGTGTGVMADLARENSLGLATSLTNLGTAVSRNVANIIATFDNMSQEVTGKSIAEHIDGMKVLINNSFNVIRSVIEATTPVFKVLATTVGIAFDVFKALSPVIIGATTAFVGFMIVQKANTIISKASTSTGILASTINLLTGRLKAGEAATKAFAAAKKLLGGPVGMITLGVGALVGGIVGLVKWFRRESKEAKRLNAETEKLADSTNELADSVKSGEEAYKNSQAEVKASAKANDDLMKKVEELAKIEHKSAAEKELLNAYTQELNDSIDGLNLAYDEEAGKLNMSSKELQARLDLYKEQETANEAMDRAREITEEQVKAEEKLAEASALREEWNEKLEEGSVKSREHKKAIEELDEQERILEDTLADLAVQYEATELQVEESMAAVAEATRIAAENQVLSFDTLSESHQSLVNDMKTVWQDLAEASTDIFEKISEDAEVSFSDMQEIFDHNVKATEEWASNLEKLAEAGVSSAFLDTFREKGPESAALVQELVDADIAEVIKLGDGFEKQTKKALDQMAQAYNLDKTQFDAVKHLVEDVGMTFTEAINSAGFDQYGKDITDGVSEGVYDGTDDVVQTVAEMSDAMDEVFRKLNDIHSPSGVYEGYGVNIIEGLANGVDNNVSNAVKAITKLVKDMLKEFDGIKASFTSIGKDAMSGLNNGLESGRKTVMNKARTIANSVASTMRNALQVRSPSRVLTEIGRWTGVGLADGIAGTQKLVARASEGLAQASIPEISMDYATPSGIQSSLSSAINGTVDVNTRDSMTAKAIASLADRLDGMQVVMEGEQVGVLVAPTVSREIQAETNGEVRRRGGRSIW